MAQFLMELIGIGMQLYFSTYDLTLLIDSGCSLIAYFSGQREWAHCSYRIGSVRTFLCFFFFTGVIKG